jgi:beta-lactamase regulating signal transducer with metallopeptidase domain
MSNQQHSADQSSLVLEQINELENRITLTEVDLEQMRESLLFTKAKVTGFESFADDLISMSTTLTDQVGVTASNTLQAAELVVTQTDMVVGTVLWVIGGLLALITIAIQVFFNIRDADRVRRLSEKIVEQADFINEVAQSLIRNDRFTENMDISVRNRVQSQLDMRTATGETKDSENKNDY